MSGPPTILNGANIPLTFQQGTVPNMTEALTDWLQKMSFTQVVKTGVGFEVLETPTTTTFWGVIMPFSVRQLQLLPEGQRAWTWYNIYTQYCLTLQVDDVIQIIGINLALKNARVMSRENFSQYSYVHYTLVEDWINSGP
jgi:hypothetical protein